MVLLIIGALVCLAIWVVAGDFSSSLKREFYQNLSILLFCFITIIVSIPFNGYNDWELVQETNLENISTKESDVPVYLVINDDNSYQYKSDEKDQDLNAHILIEYSSQKHVLQEYIQKPKTTFWNCPSIRKHKYIFIVPEKSISVK